ncbi:unnamed protein product [Rangifer tarandus platyrhynchus]|uniref:Uncharacterized protein n=1 Tax=Rangifer tarandus platyrhynchus TaxID=3082113 RepID=A0ABN8YC99_RANTA|nr:unnamed protein product [Rangifer tarandus platyrhynchus]
MMSSRAGGRPQEAQVEGDPTHSLVPSQMETPEGIQEEVRGKGKRLSGAPDRGAPPLAFSLMDSSPPPPEPLATPAPQTHPCQLSMSLHAPDEQFRLPSTLGQRPENSPQLRPQPLCQVTESRLFYLLRDTTTLTRPEDNICRATSRRTSAP